MTPEPCFNNERCWSPIACNAFGYCRERNDGKAVSDSMIEKRRELAAARRAVLSAAEQE